jgi:hypothetical protein
VLYTYWGALVDGETPAQGFEDANRPLAPAISAFFAVAAAKVGPERGD